MKKHIKNHYFFPEGQATEAWQQTEGGGEETPEVAETASSVNMARDHELRPAGASHQCHRQVEKFIHGCHKKLSQRQKKESLSVIPFLSLQW